MVIAIFIHIQAFDTRELNIYDKDECKRGYQTIKGRVEDGIETLLRLREADPYFDPIKRAVYEAIAGEQAPTANLNKQW